MSEEKRIYICTTNTLPGHVIVDVSSLQKTKFLERIKNKYNLEDVCFIYCADFMFRMGVLGVTRLNSINDISIALSDFLSPKQSKFGSEIYKSNLKDLINLVSNDYYENYDVSIEYKDLMETKRRSREREKNRIDVFSCKEKEFTQTFQNQYDEVNKKWSEFWDKRIEIFHNYILNNKFPEKQSSLFFAERRRLEFEELSKKYYDNLRAITKEWWEESKTLKSHLNVKCRYCGIPNKINFKLFGPGNSGTLGGFNWNTEEIPRGHRLYPRDGYYPYAWKLKNGHKYYWRSIFSLEGKCFVCNKSLMVNNVDGIDVIDNLAKLENSNRCAIYPCDSKESFCEWSGVWMTIFECKRYQLESIK